MLCYNPDMTQLVYYNDPECINFSAEVLSAVKTESGIDVILDRTCFYPEGGGQPADRGTLNGLPVTDVRKKDGIVIHRLNSGSEAGEPFSVGMIIEGLIEEEHRIDYMQQHSGQHVISAAMMKTGEIATVSVHQGEEYTAIETPQKSISTELLYRIEEEANRVVNADIPINAHWTDSSGLTEFSLRRPSKHDSNIRIIEIPDVDCVACGGLHLKTTGRIGLIKYIRQEKIRGQIRTFWKIGHRATEDYRKKTEIINELCRLHSAQQHDILSRIKASSDSYNELKFNLGKLQREYAELFADRLIGEADKTATGMKLVIRSLEGRDRRFIETLMTHFASDSEPLLALIFNKTEDKLTWALACSDKNCGQNDVFDFNTFRSDYLVIIGGKGGGRAPIWQGVVQTPEKLDEMLKVLRTSLLG